MVDADEAINGTEAAQGRTFPLLSGLAVAARHHGIDMSVPQIVRSYALGPEPPGLAQVIQIAKDQGLTARSVRMNWSQLMRIGQAVPALLSLEDGSVLVLVGVNPTHAPPVVLVRDPADAEGTVVPMDEIALRTRWTGSVLLLKRRYAASDDTQPFSLWWVVGLMLRDRAIFRDIAIASLVVSFLSLAPALVLMTIVDRIVVYQRPASLFSLAAIAGFLVLAVTVFGYLRRYLIALGTARMDAKLLMHIFDRVVGLPLDVFERASVGVIAHKMSEVGKIRNFLTHQFFTTVVDLMTLLVILPVLFLLSATLTWVVIGIGIVMAVIVWAYIPSIGRAYARVVSAEQAKGQVLIETLQGMRTVKSLALEGRKRRDWDRHSAEAVRAQRDMLVLLNQPQTLLDPLQQLIFTGVLVLGAYLAITGDQGVQLGSLLAFVVISGRAVQPFTQLAQLLQTWEEVRGAIAQVSSIVNLPPEPTRSDRGLRPRFRGGIVFDEVRFKYAGAQNFAINGASFEIEPGMVVGVMGRSGSGKTTVTRLLQGLHQDYGGLIKIDGADLRELDLTYLRTNLGVVLQDSFLFRGTIRENIAMGRSDATFEEVIRAARLAGAEEFIERLPRGYDTLVEEGSTNLSGGQRQRIAIARALILDPKILILDEATSALDPDSEAIVNNNLSRIARGRTTVIVSHRLTSLVACDRIFVMERGKVVDSGRHEELLEQCEIYRHLWYQQNRHTSSSSGGPNERTLLASGT